jgi:hypothetical protein
MGLERLFIPLEYFLKDKIHQNYPLEKFLRKINGFLSKKINILWV